MNHEYRVAITSAGVHTPGLRGHEVAPAARAGIGSSFDAVDYKALAAQVLDSADGVR